jgi:hypothetical protein
MTDFIANYFHYLIVLAPFIAGFVIYSELKSDGFKFYDSRGEYAGTQVHFYGHVFTVK